MQQTHTVHSLQSVQLHQNLSNAMLSGTCPIFIHRQESTAFNLLMNFKWISIVTMNFTICYFFVMWLSSSTSNFKIRFFALNLSINIFKMATFHHIELWKFAMFRYINHRWMLFCFFLQDFTETGQSAAEWWHPFTIFSFKTVNLVNYVVIVDPRHIKLGQFFTDTKWQ